MKAAFACKMAHKIKKIVDCKVNENGQVLYHVKWRETWEFADKLEPLYSDVIEEFWETINVWGNAKNGIPTPARKRKRMEDDGPITPTMQQSLLPAPQLTAHVQSVPYGSGSQQVSPSLSTTMFQQSAPLFNIPSSATTPPSSKRGRGRGRGGRGRGSSAIKKEIIPQAQQNMASAFPMFNSNVNEAFPLDPKQVPHQYSSNGVQQQFSPQDIKPTILPSGQIAPSPGNHMFNNYQSTPESPRGQGRGRGRGRGGFNNTGAQIKEEKMKSEAVTGQELAFKQGVPKSSSAPNLLSGDTQYDSWSNPYAKLVLICRQCSKEQNPRNKSSWKMHYESHTDLKNFGCYVCEKRFRLKGDLKTHITRVHQEEFLEERVIRYNETAPVPTIDPSEIVDGWANPYVKNVFLCKECNRELQWKSRAAWKTHYESHLDIKRFGCYVCQKPFRLKGDLKTHITRVHKEEFQEERVIRLE